MTERLSRRLLAEALGTAFLLMAVVGSGIMGERLAGGNAAVALLANTVATGAALIVLISIFGPLSGAHFNPVVSFYFWLRRESSLGHAFAYSAVQIAGAVLGVWVAHVMFGLPIFETSQKLRNGLAVDFADAVATFGLILTIAGALRYKLSAPILVGLYITAAYWFTASTSFANPAAVIGRALTDSFAGIAPSSAPGFVIGEMVGGLAGLLVCNWLFAEPGTLTEDTLAPR